MMVEVSKPVPTCWEGCVCECDISEHTHIGQKDVCVCVCVCVCVRYTRAYKHWPNFMVRVVSQKGMSGYA